jgi:hypothetical protein
VGHQLLKVPMTMSSPPGALEKSSRLPFFKAPGIMNIEGVEKIARSKEERKNILVKKNAMKRDELCTKDAIIYRG